MPDEEPDVSRPPTLSADNFFAVRAHGALKAFRRYEFAPDGFREPRRITLEDIERYAAKFGPHGVDGFGFFMRQIGVMEDVFMEIAMEQLDTQRRAQRTRRG